MSDSHCSADAGQRHVTLKHVIRFWLPVIFYCAVIFVQSAGSVPVEGPEIPFFDKIAHFGGYALLGALSFRAVHSHNLPYGRGWTILFSGYLAMIYGLGDELHQSMVPVREGDGLDALADALGGYAGAWVFGMMFGGKGSDNAKKRRNNR